MSLRRALDAVSFVANLLPLLLVTVLACRMASDGAAGADPRAVTAGPAPALFADATAEAGLDFRHWNGAIGRLWMVEMMGAGGALFDMDGDGDLDLLARQGAALDPPGPSPLGGDRLYRNDLLRGPEGSRRVRFVDVTAQSGITRAAGYGMGAAAGDSDNDGLVDLYLTDFGPNRLLHNGGGRFSDRTAEAGVGDERWSVAASFVDIDADGWLDLYVGNYVDFSVAGHRLCRRASSAPDYCSPLAYGAEPDRLFRNRGDGTFENITARAGLAVAYGRALGVVTVDADADGWLDLYVANDATENQLWRNRGDGTFEDVAIPWGAAVNDRGEREGSMGLDAGDFDGDGDPDFFLSHMATETNTLYVNHGGFYLDGSRTSGLAAPSRPFTGFGAAWIDYDNDGWLDVLVVKGAVRIIEAQEAAGAPLPLTQTNQLFRNTGGGRFEEVTAQGGEVFELSEVSRGAAFGDVDDDGDTDVVVFNNGGPLRLLRNELGQSRSWIGLHLVGTPGRRDMLGAAVTVERPGLPSLHRWVRSDGSYASANDPRILVGLGEAAEVGSVRVIWPGGEIEEFSGLSPGSYHTLAQGQGRRVVR